MEIKVKVDVDLSRIEKVFSHGNIKKSKTALANQILKDMTQYVPFRGGDLRADGRVTDGGSYIRYRIVYARAHYYGTNGIVTFSKYTTPGTGTNWLNKTSGNIGKWENIVAKGLGV
ncbi:MULTISPECIES: minor capsid protein [unclassified Gemella]|uniref:minor capsid protein n=1 Tax=unclassified Gemella TaxID=2624949 RepID=UPI001C54D89C|nr:MULTISPECIES: minor capsid protein [unclassified Gemella]